MYGATIQLLPVRAQTADCRAGCETRELVRVQMNPYPISEESQALQWLKGSPDQSSVILAHFQADAFHGKTCSAGAACWCFPLSASLADAAGLQFCPRKM